MERFEVRALAKSGVVLLSIDAADVAAASQHVHSQGHVVLSVSKLAKYRNKGERFSLLLFTQELLALHRAGLTLVDALQALAERQTSAHDRELLDGVLKSVRDGKPLSAALARYPKTFPTLYVETVRASERTGAINEALTRFVAYQGEIDRIRQKLVSALIYPALLLVVGLLVTAFLLAYVVPRFSGIYADLGHDLPLASRVLFELGTAIDNHLAGAAVLTLAAGFAIALALRAEGTRRMVARIAMRAPMLGERIRVYHLTRLYRTTSMLLKGGVPLASALDMCAGVLDSGSRPQLVAATRDVREGTALSLAFERNALATGIASRMLRVGERSGDLGALLTQAAAFHEEELTRWVERSTRLFEPVLMMVIGLMIGAIVVLMYLPIFDLAGSLQ